MMPGLFSAAGGVVGSEAAQAGQELTDVLLSAAAGALLDWLYATSPMPTWELEPVDTLVNYGTCHLRGQGPPDSFTEAGQNTITTSSGWQTFRPSTAPANGAPPAWDLEQTYVATDRTVDLGDVLTRLRTMRDRNKTLRRPPKMRLTYGQFCEEVWLETYDHAVPEGYWPETTRPIVLKVRLRLVKVETHALRTKPLFPKETSWRVLGEGQTFEDVALDAFRDPEIGLLLRRINPEVLEESPGTKIKILQRDHDKMQDALSPKAPCFVQDFATTVQAIALERLDLTGADWAALEDLGDIEEGAPTLFES